MSFYFSGGREERREEKRKEFTFKFGLFLFVAPSKAKLSKLAG